MDWAIRCHNAGLFLPWMPLVIPSSFRMEIPSFFRSNWAMENGSVSGFILGFR